MAKFTFRGSVFLLVPVLSTWLSGCASIEVYHDYQPKMEGVMYRLPRGALIINVPVVRTTYESTSLTPYAMTQTGDFEGLPTVELPEEWGEGAYLSPETSLSIYTSGAPTMNYSVEPDPDQTYFVRIRGDATQNRNLKLTLSRMGLMTEGESHVQDKKLELVLATVEAAAKIGGSAFGFRDGPPKTLTSAPTDPIRQKSIELRIQLKELAARRLQWIAAVKSQLPETFNLVMRAFETEESKIASQFVSVSKLAYEIPFEARPYTQSKSNNAWDVDLLTLDRSKGVAQYIRGEVGEVVGPVDLPATLFNPEGATKPIVTAVRLSIKRSRAYALAVIPSPEFQGPTGFAYRIPGAVEVSITSHRNGALHQAYLLTTVQLPQAGHIMTLPRHAGLSPENHVSLALYEETGALKSLNVESKAIDPELIRNFGTNISETLDKVSAARQAAEAATAAKPSRMAQITARAKEFAELVGALQAAGLPIPPLPSPTGETISE